MKKVIKRCLYRDGLCSRRNGFGRWWHHKVVVQNGIQAFAKFKNAVHCISENFITFKTSYEIIIIIIIIIYQFI